MLMFLWSAPPLPCPISPAVDGSMAGIAASTEGSNAVSGVPPNCGLATGVGIVVLHRSVVLLSSCDCGGSPMLSCDIPKFRVGTAVGTMFVSSVDCDNSSWYWASNCC